jgi:hypothetical protein
MKDILFVSSDNSSYSVSSFIEAFEKKYSIKSLELRYQTSLFERVFFKLVKLKYFIFTKNLENRLLKELELTEYRYLFLVKQLFFKPKFYLKIKKLHPAIKIIGLTYDYLGNYNTGSINLSGSLKYYDIFFAPQEHYNRYIKKKGCIKSYEINFSVSDSLYELSEKLYMLSPEIKYDVLVVANYEKERALYVEYLLAQGVKVKIVGCNWYKAFKCQNIFKVYKEIKHISIEEVIMATIQSKVTIGFLRKAELDRITARSFEIPAFYGYMLHEDNTEIRSIYSDADFVDFFNTKEDLASKVIKVLSSYNDKERKIKKESAHRWIKKNRLLTSNDVNKMTEILEYEN